MDLDFHGPLLTPSDLLEHQFCGRFTYFDAIARCPNSRDAARRSDVAASSTPSENRPTAPTSGDGWASSTSEST